APGCREGRQPFDQFVQQPLRVRGIVAPPFVDAAIQRDRQLRAESGDAGNSAVPPRIQASPEEPVVANQERPVIAPRVAKYRQVLTASAAVLDADDELLVAKERQSRLRRQTVREI